MAKVNKQLVRITDEEIGTRTRIYQSNRVTNAVYNYSLLQERIFNYSMYFLQGYISRVMNGEKIQQIELFGNPDDIKITIPLKYIGTSGQYERIKEAAKGMVSSLISMKYKGIHGQDVISFAGLFSEIQMDEKRAAHMVCYMRKSVAAYLINIDINEANKPKNYTGFLLEIALNAKAKYTPRVYKMISSWATKGGFYITLEDLRKVLCLGEKYKDYNLIKRRILIPAQEELKATADCWFNMSDTEEVKEGKKVIGLRFKVVTVSIEKQRELLLHNLYDVLQKYFGISKEQYEQLRPVFQKVSDHNEIIEKIGELHEKLHDSRGEIGNVQAYVIKSFLNHFNKI